MKVAFIDDDLTLSPQQFQEVNGGNAKPYADSMVDKFGAENVYFFSRGTDFITFITQQPFLIDLAFIDHSLKGKIATGDQLALKVLEVAPHITMVMFTASNDFETCRMALRSGFSDFLLKSSFAGLTDGQEFDQKWTDEINRMLNLSLVKTKLEEKKKKEHSEKNWDSYINALKTKDFPASGAYNKARWILVEGLLKTKDYAALGINQINHVLPILQTHCQQYINQHLDNQFTFNKLAKCKNDTDRENTSALNWLAGIQEFIDRPFSDALHSAVRKARLQTGAGANIFTNYLTEINHKQDKLEQAFWFLLQDQEDKKFTKIQNFEPLKRLATNIADQQIPSVAQNHSLI
jgi:response regulator of citrate/malate metabolism